MINHDPRDRVASDFIGETQKNQRNVLFLIYIYYLG